MSNNNSKKIYTYTSASGYELILNPLPPLQIQLVRDAAIKEAEKLYGERLGKPTYTIGTDDGAEETHEHDEATIAQDPEAKKAWDAWQAQEAQIDAFANEKIMRFILLRGVSFEMPESDDWMEMQKYFGIDVPETGLDRRFHYIQTEVIGSVTDLTGLMSRIMEISGVDEETVAAAQATFRDTLGEQGRAGAGESTQ